MERPPRGTTRVHCAGASPDAMRVISWEPGNGCCYQMAAVLVPDVAVELMGGAMLVVFSSMADRTGVAHIVSPARTATWTVGYVQDKWKRIHRIGDHAPFLAMLLNWALGGPRARSYADELWTKHMGKCGKVVRIGSVRR